jgi:hypothetical protein
MASLISVDEIPFSRVEGLLWLDGKLMNNKKETFLGCNNFEIRPWTMNVPYNGSFNLHYS